MISPSSLFAATKMPTFLSGRSATVACEPSTAPSCPTTLRAAIIRKVPAQGVEIVVRLRDGELGRIMRDRRDHRAGPHLLRLLFAKRASCRCRGSCRGRAASGASGSCRWR